MANSSPPAPPSRTGLFFKFVEFLFKVFSLVMISAVMTVCIEWIGMAYYFEDRGYKDYEHAQEMMVNEYQHFTAYIQTGDSQVFVMKKTTDLIRAVHRYLLVDSTFFSILTTARLPYFRDTGLERYFRSLIIEYYVYGMAAAHILVVFFIRLCILILSFPSFLLFAFVGLAEGLMQRDLRRMGGGNESGYIYHWAKKLTFPVISLCWVVYLSIPGSIHPNYIITPFSFLFGVLIMVMASKFKKYV